MMVAVNFFNSRPEKSAVGCQAAGRKNSVQAVEAPLDVQSVIQKYLAVANSPQHPPEACYPRDAEPQK